MKETILRTLKSIISGAVFLLLITSCEKDEVAVPVANGYLSLSISAGDPHANGRIAAIEEDYRYLVVSIKNEDGVYVINNQRLELTKLGNGYFTENIMLKVGEYTIEDFIVLDSGENAVLISPKEASEYADYVEDPLPVACSIAQDKTIVKSAEVIDATIDDPATFGYAILTFNVVSLVNLEDGLIAHYDFNGDATDKSGNGYHAGVFGATLTSSRKGQADGAYRFNGSSDYMNTGIVDSVLLGLGSFSFGCWVKFDSLNNNRQVMISNTVDGNAMWALRLEDNRVTTGIVNQHDSVKVRWTQIIENGNARIVAQHNWYHFMTVYDGEMLRLYMNGQELAAKAAIGTLARQGSSSRTIHLGTNASKRSTHSLEGVLDDVRMYSRALSPLEIERLYSE